MTSRQEFRSVGTTATPLFMSNLKRKGWRVTFLSSAVEVANTGRVHVGKGFVPTTTLGEPNVGEIMSQSSEITERKRFKEDAIWTGDIWGIASVANQRVLLEEELED